MKKTLIASCALTLACAAYAQSSVTIFGVLDATMRHARQAGESDTRMVGTGGNQYSRFGFRGIEDLGGGLSAGFVLDAGLNIATGSGGAGSANNQTAIPAGAVMFNRRSTVSFISRELGELRFGRDFAPHYWNLTNFDPFGTAGAGSVNNLAQGALTRVSTVQTALRVSNSVGYFLPSMGGLYGQAMYASGKNASDAPGGTGNDGNYAGVRLGYNFGGGFNVAISHGETQLASGDVSTSNAGVSYTLGPAKLMAQYFRDSKEDVAAPSRSHGWLVGAQVQVGVGYFPVSYTVVKDNTAAGRKANQIAIGYVHNLSKRTALYTTLSRIDNKNGAALTGGIVPGVANASWRALDLGIRHTF